MAHYKRLRVFADVDRARSALQIDDKTLMSIIFCGRTLGQNQRCILYNAANGAAVVAQRSAGRTTR
jgi:hypothetical protein